MFSVKPEHPRAFLETLIEKNVLFCGQKLPFSSLLPQETNNNSTNYQWLNENSLKELATESEPVIDTRHHESKQNKHDQSVYIQRTLVRSVEVHQSAIQALNQSISFLAEDYEMQTEQFPHQAAHLISIVNQGKQKRFIWKKSHGSIKELLPYIFQDSLHQIRDSITEKELLKSQNSKIIIISSPEGTGKSTLLTYLTETMLSSAETPQMWPIRVNLNEQTLFNEKTVNFDKESAVKMLVEHLIRWPRQQSNNLSKSLLKHRLQSQGGRICLMFDGLDEVKDNAVNLIRSLVEYEGVERILITGRSREIEEKLDELSYQLADFTRSDKIDYLIKYWKSDSSDPAVKEFAEQIVSIKSTETGQELGNWPFQCKMLAEIFSKDLSIHLRCRNVKLVNPIQSMSYVDLYRLFWASKCDAFHSKIVSIFPLDIRSREDAANILTCYLLRLAVKYVFCPTDAANLFYYIDDPPKWIAHSQEAIDHLDLTRKVPDIKLTHPLLSEYLIAEFIFKAFNQEKSQLIKTNASLIIEKVLVSCDFKGIRLFFDSMLQSSLPNEDYNELFFPGAILPAILSHFKFNDQFTNSDDRKLVLQVAGRERSAGILNFVLFCARESMARSSKNLKWNDLMASFLSPLESSFIHSAPHCEVDVQVSERVFRWFESADCDTLKELLDTTREVFVHPKVVFDFIHRHLSILDADYLSALLFDEAFNLNEMLRARSGFDDSDNNCVDLVIDYLKQLFSSSSCETVKSRASDWFTRFEAATLEGANFKLLNLLVHHFKLNQDEIKKCVSHALEMEPDLLLKHLDFNENDPLGKDDYQLTNLQKAALQGDGETLKMLIKLKKDDESIEEVKHLFIEQRASCLYLAARCANEDICEEIVQFMHSNSTYASVRSRLTNPGRCLSKALFDSLPRGKNSDLKVVKLIVMLVLRHYGRDVVFSMINSLIEEFDDLTALGDLFKFIKNVFGSNGLCDVICSQSKTEIIARLAEESRNEVLELTIESVLNCRGDVALVDLLFGPVSIEDSVTILSNELVQCYLPGKLRSSGLTRLIEVLTRRNELSSIWSAYCTHYSKPFTHVQSILKHVLQEVALGERKLKSLLLCDGVFKKIWMKNRTAIEELMLLERLSEDFLHGLGLH